MKGSVTNINIKGLKTFFTPKVVNLWVLKKPSNKLQLVHKVHASTLQSYIVRSLNHKIQFLSELQFMSPSQ